MARRLATLLLLIIGLVVLSSGVAQAATLSMKEARAFAAKQAQKVKRDLKSEGATRAKVPGCWRNSASQVSCFFSVYGYDKELDYRWQCMMRIVVKKRDSIRAARSGSRYKVKYGTPHCG